MLDADPRIHRSRGTTAAFLIHAVRIALRIALRVVRTERTKVLSQKVRRASDINYVRYEEYDAISTHVSLSPLAPLPPSNIRDKERACICVCVCIYVRIPCIT